MPEQLRLWDSNLYIYLYRERETERDRQTDRQTDIYSLRSKTSTSRLKKV